MLVSSSSLRGSITRDHLSSDEDEAGRGEDPGDTQGRSVHVRARRPRPWSDLGSPNGARVGPLVLPQLDLGEVGSSPGIFQGSAFLQAHTVCWPAPRPACIVRALRTCARTRALRVLCHGPLDTESLTTRRAVPRSHWPG